MSDFKPGWYATSAPKNGRTTYYYFQTRTLITGECYTTSDGKQILVNSTPRNADWKPSYEYAANEAGGKWDSPGGKTVAGKKGQAPSVSSGKSRCEDTSIPCEVCDKKGFSILPVRYAIARTDVETRAAKLEGAYSESFTDIALGAAQAEYTLRLLRAGYLYVFNEVRGEWKAYEVDDDAYLSEFNINDKAPPPAQELAPKPCGRRATSRLGRSVFIPDPGRAGAVWFGFTDTAWTADVLAKNKIEKNRAKHMRRIDVGAWAAKKGKATQPHLGPLVEDAAKVADFKFNVEPPTDGSIQVHGGPAALMFSRAHVCQHSKAEVEGFVDAAQSAAKGMPPGMVALNDPVGCALDLNHLMTFRIAQFERQDNRGWKKATGVGIEGIRHAMEEQGLADALKDKQVAYFMGQGRYGIGEMPTSLTNEEQVNAKKDAWKRYSDDYSESSRISFEQKLEADMAKFYTEKLTPIAKAFVAWYRCKPFVDNMVLNHDEAHLGSGESFTRIVAVLLSDIMGHKVIADTVQAELAGMFSNIENITMRGLCLNNSEAAKKLEESLSPQLEMGNPGAWTNVNKAFSHVLQKGAAGELDGPMAKIAKLAYNISGPIVTILGKAGSGAVNAALGKAIDVASRYRMVSLVGVLSGKPLRRIQIMATDRELAHALVESLARSNPEIDRQKLREEIDAKIRRDLGSESGARTATNQRNAQGRRKFEWAFFVDDSVRAGNLNGLMLTQSQLDAIVSSRTAKYLNLDSAMGVASMLLDGWNAYDAYSKLNDEKEGPELRRQMNLGVALAGFTGTTVELTSVAMKATSWGQLALARQFTFMSNEVASRAALVGFCGKVLGTVAAFLSAIIDGWKAVDAYKKGDLPMAAVFLTTAVGGAVVAWMMFAGTLTAGVGFIVLLVLAALALLAEWIINRFRDNKIEKWLQKTPFGTKEDGSFGSLSEQEAAWKALLPGGAK